MQIKIIGSAAGGGFPQWNCNFRLSRAARNGAAGVRPRTQSSLAVSADGKDWVLFNASPDIRQQIAETPALQPPQHGPLRSSPIRAIVLTNADVDHIAGLLSLRERQPFALYGTERVLSVLAENPVFEVLHRRIVPRRALQVDTMTGIADADGEPTGIRIEAFDVPGKIALYLEDQADAADYHSDEGDTIGIRLVAGERGPSFFYIPACARIDGDLKARLDGAAGVLFDGTLYTDDEMIAAGVGRKTGARMGHLAMSGPAGTVEGLADLVIGRRIFVHINNTNPVLDEASPEHGAVRAAGWEVAYDGMEITA